jgi:hypothetical protein
LTESVVQRRLFLKGLKSLLEVELGIPVGISRAPRDGNGEFFDPPYACLHPVSTFNFEGPPLCNPESSATFEIQVDYHGLRDDQAEFLGDKGFKVLVGKDAHGTLLNKVEFEGGVVVNQFAIGGTGGLDNVGQIWTRSDSFGFAVTST